MLKYNLGSLANRRKGMRGKLPIITPSIGAETSYLKVLRVMLRAIASAVTSELLPVVERDRSMQQLTDAFVKDVTESDFERMDALARVLANSAMRSFTRILDLEAKRHTRTFMASAKRAFGVDLSAVVKDNDLADYLDASAARNAGLIKGLAQSTVDRVQTLVTTAVVQGIPAKDLRKQLVDGFGISDRRAKVIARDQISKVTSDLNIFRHKQAGIERYIWRTSHDERVRPRHRKLDGIEYAYGEETGAEQGLPPGQPILCRCIAEAIVEF